MGRVWRGEEWAGFASVAACSCGTRTTSMVAPPRRMLPSPLLLLHGPQAPSASLSAAMAKRFATDACFGVASDALQLLGGYGYLCDYPLVSGGGPGGVAD